MVNRVNGTTLASVSCCDLTGYLQYFENRSLIWLPWMQLRVSWVLKEFSEGVTLLTSNSACFPIQYCVLVMGNNEKSKASSKSGESNSPAVPDQASVHVYPDWAAMQAYYGHRVPLPPYYNSAMIPGQVPHPYVWGPPQKFNNTSLLQHMMPPYGGAYAAMYPHAGVYAHPAAPVASAVHSHGIQSPALGEAVSQDLDTPEKSSKNADKGLINKLKGFDGLAMSLGNGGEHAGDADQGMSQSSQTGGISDGSNGYTAEGAKAQTKRRNHEETLTMGSGGKNEPASAGLLTDTDSDSSKVPLNTPGPVGIAGKLLGAVISSSISIAPEISSSPSRNAKIGIIGLHHGTPVLAESWMQNERELKRERRKQSNRESARRSRLRKQAEAEELSVKVDSLSAENVTLKSELSRIAEKSKQLKLENAILLDKLHNAKLGEEAILNEVDDKMVQPISTENLLSRVNNTCPVNQNDEEEDDYRNKKAKTKLHQLLDRKPRSNAVAAS